MKVQITFNNVWDGQKQVTTVIDFDVEQHIKDELDAAAAKSEGGWDSLREVQHKLTEILQDDMDVEILH